MLKNINVDWNSLIFLDDVDLAALIKQDKKYVTIIYLCIENMYHLPNGLASNILIKMIHFVLHLTYGCFGCSLHSLQVILVDHNSLSGHRALIPPEQHLLIEEKVSTIIDHHVDTNHCPNTTHRVVETVGSCSSLIAREIGAGKSTTTTFCTYRALYLTGAYWCLCSGFAHWVF